MPFPLLSAATAGGPPRWLDSLPYQVVGLCVVFTAVGMVWLLMEGIGLVLRWLERNPEPAACPAEVAPPTPAPPPLPVPVPPPQPALPLLPPPDPPPVAIAPPPPPPPPPPVVDGVPPEIVVVICTAVYAWVDAGVNIVSIVPVDRTHEQNLLPLAWSNEGRRQHFASHKVR